MSNPTPHDAWLAEAMRLSDLSATYPEYCNALLAHLRTTPEGYALVLVAVVEQRDALLKHVTEAEKCCFDVAKQVHAFDPMSVLFGDLRLESTLKMVMYSLAAQHKKAMLAAAQPAGKE